MANNTGHTTPDASNDGTRMGQRQREIDVLQSVREFFTSELGREFYQYFMGEVCGGYRSCFDTDALKMANKAGRQEVGMYLRSIVEGTAIEQLAAQTEDTPEWDYSGED